MVDAGSASDAAQVDVNREGFLAMVVGALSETLSDTVGSREAEGFFNLVGISLAEQILARYLADAGTARLDLAKTLDALLDWHKRIGGEFQVLESTDRRIVLVNRRCPFAGVGMKPDSMCKVTSHVLGHMVAESQGYGRITIARGARGARGCRVVIDLDALDGAGQPYYARRVR